jgi:hypothetical protein
MPGSAAILIVGRQSQKAGTLAPRRADRAKGSKSPVAAKELSGGCFIQRTASRFKRLPVIKNRSSMRLTGWMTGSH